MIHFAHHRGLHDKDAEFYIVSALLISFLFILGVYFIKDAEFNFSSYAFGGLLLSAALIALTLLVRLLKTTQTKTIKTPAWHIELNGQTLTWSAPDHSLGEEKSFCVYLKEIKKIERHRLIGYGALNQIDYFLLYKSGERIQLRNFSGIALDELCLAIEKLGVLVEQRDV